MAMKFRRTCSSCNATFFSEDRRAPYCPKCARKKAAAPPPPPPSFAKSSGRPPGKDFSKPGGDPRKRPEKPKRPAQPRIPKASELTPELRTKIETAFLQIPEGPLESLKKLHAQISHAVWVKPKLVADVLVQLRKQRASNEKCTLPEADRQKVLTHYLALIAKDMRPEEGRRAYLAKELNLPPREVVLAIREWSLNVMGRLTRQQLFEIEKCYWHLIQENGHYKYVQLPELIANKVGFASSEQIARWLDQIHDNTKLLKVNVNATDEQKEQVIKLYKDYLQESVPPLESLHHTLAKAVGLNPNQVHRILCDYRRELRPS